MTSTETKGEKMQNLKAVLAACAAVLMLGGCFSDDNNYLQPRDFAPRLQEAGIKVTSVRDLPGEPFKATSGAAMMVAGSEIGVYKYDRTSKVQSERIAKRKRTGRAYINGIPYPVEVYGSFMFMGLEKNRKKHEILKVIRTFN
jgi:hypothetical protein